MTTTVHKNLTGADLHEPKGADTALASQVYVSDGAGSGSWTNASSIITNTAFTTGDLKITHKATADTSWILWIDGTIGDASSGATVRANADVSNLFALYWNNYSNTLCPVSTGRGASAAADFAAHKTITLPVGLGRALGNAGNGLGGVGLSGHPLGSATGAETGLLAANQIPSLTSSGSNSISVTASLTDITRRGASNAYTAVASPGSGAYGFNTNSPSDCQPISSGTNTITVAYTNASQQTVSLMQPIAFVNVMIKL